MIYRFSVCLLLSLFLLGYGCGGGGGGSDAGGDIVYQTKASTTSANQAGPVGVFTDIEVEFS